MLTTTQISAYLSLFNVNGGELNALDTSADLVAAKITRWVEPYFRWMGDELVLDQYEDFEKLDQEQQNYSYDLARLVSATRNFVTSGDPYDPGLANALEEEADFELVDYSYALAQALDILKSEYQLQIEATLNDDNRAVYLFGADLATTAGMAALPMGVMHYFGAAQNVKTQGLFDQKKPANEVDHASTLVNVDDLTVHGFVSSNKIRAFKNEKKYWRNRGQKMDEASLLDFAKTDFYERSAAKSGDVFAVSFDFDAMVAGRNLLEILPQIVADLKVMDSETRDLHGRGVERVFVLPQSPIERLAYSDLLEIIYQTLEPLGWMIFD